MSNECPTCGSKMVEYKHGLSKGLSRSLYRISQSLGENNVFHIGECGLTYSQRENCRKLQYWGIIKKLEDDNEKGGWWRLTKAGEAFITGRLACRKSVWTYRGKFVRYEGPSVLITDLTGGWKYRPDYAREAMPAPHKTTH